MLRFLKSIAFLALIGAVIYLWLFGKPVESGRQQTTIVAETPIKRLSAFVDTHLDKIFCPLAPDQTLMPSQELRQVEQTLQDLRSKAASDRERRLYDSGIALSKQMIEAIAIRESHNRRIADMRAKGFDSPMSDPKHKKAEEKKKQEFFESGVRRSWESKASLLRGKIQGEYARMRLLER